MAKFNPADHLMKLKGKDYLEVKWRLVWLREEHPDATITTEHIAIEDNRAVFKATISLANGGGATGYGSETQKDFGDFLEKAETKAIGRALAALGYGTQFAPEMEEGARVVDSPVERPTAPQKPSQAPAKPTPINGNGDKPATKVALDRMHAILNDHQLNHDHLHAYALKAGHTTSKDLTMDQLKVLADSLKNNRDATVARLVELKGLAEANAAVNAQLDMNKGAK